MCGAPTKELVGFYEEGKDETLGTMLKRLCKMANNICDHCTEPMHKHYIDYYHKCGRIEIQIALHTKNDPQIKSQISLMGINSVKAEHSDKKSDEIIIRTECQTCKG